MKLRIFKKHPIITASSHNVGVELEGILLGGVSELELYLKAGELNKCKLTIIPTEIEIDADVEAEIRNLADRQEENGVAINKDESGMISLTPEALIKIINSVDSPQKLKEYIKAINKKTA